MATVHHVLEFRSTPAEVWAKVADVGAVNKIMPFLGDVTLDGDRRTCAIGDAALEELIVTIDPDRRRLAYAIVGGPLPFVQHSATMQVVPKGDGCVLEWTHDFKPDELRPAFAESLAPAVEGLRRTIR